MTGVPESQQGKAACPCTGDSSCAFHLRFNAWPDDPAPQPAVPERNQWNTAQGDCRNCGCPASRGHVYGERKCCPDCDHTPAVPDGAAGEALAVGGSYLAERLAEAGNTRWMDGHEQGMKDGAATVRARVEEVLERLGEQTRRLYHDDDNPREAGRVAGAIGAVRAALSGGDDL